MDLVRVQLYDSYKRTLSTVLLKKLIFSFLSKCDCQIKSSLSAADHAIWILMFMSFKDESIHYFNFTML